MTNDLLNTILSRRSIRTYTSTPVSQEKVRKILEAAMAAPSASNRQPWHFIVIKDRDTLNALADAHPYGKMLFEAPLCIAVCGDRDIADLFWIQDCSAATENLLLAVTALDLGAVWLGVFPREDRVNKIRKILKIPDNIIPLNLISIGYPAEHKEARTQYNAQKVHLEKW